MPFLTPTASPVLPVQSAQAQAASTTVTATYGATPKQFDLLIAVGFCASAVSANISINSAGWGAAKVTNDIVSNTAGLCIFAKMAGASESTSVQMTGTGATQCRLHILEYSNIALASTTPDYTSSADTALGTTCGIVAAAGGQPSVVVMGVALNGVTGGWVSWTSPMATVESTDSSTGSLWTGVMAIMTGVFSTYTGTWTSARGGGGVLAAWTNPFIRAPAPWALQGVHRAGSY